MNGYQLVINASRSSTTKVDGPVYFYLNIIKIGIGIM